MTLSRFARASSGATPCLFLCLAPLAASALTPQEAWESWKAAAERAEVSVTAGSETPDGGGLTVSNVAFAATLDDEATFSGTVEEIVFADAGNGTVRVTMSETLPFSISGTDSDGASFNAAMTMRAPDLVYTVGDLSGGGTDASYDASEITLTVDSVTEDGEPMDFAGLVRLAGIAGAYTVADDEQMTLTNNIAAESMAFNFSGSDPEEGGTFAFAMTMDDLLSASTSTGGALFALAGDWEEMIEDGFTSEGEGSVGAVSMTVSAKGAPEDFDLAMTMDGGGGKASFAPERIEYDVQYDGVAFTASGSEIPFPQVTGGLGAWQTMVSLPSAPSEDAAPVGIMLALRDVVMGEEIWGLFDPAGALPRDPATLVIDLAGQARLLTDIFSEDAMMSAEAPAEVERLDIRELRLSVAGAELTGEGGFDVDNATPGPFGPGTPSVDGTVNLTLRGSQTLLDTLVGMGLVTQDQAMMARMMTGMLARPGSGPDELVSEITVQPDGTVLANGAPLPF